MLWIFRQRKGNERILKKKNKLSNVCIMCVCSVFCIMLNDVRMYMRVFHSIVRWSKITAKIQNEINTDDEWRENRPLIPSFSRSIVDTKIKLFKFNAILFRDTKERKKKLRFARLQFLYFMFSHTVHFSYLSRARAPQFFFLHFVVVVADSFRCNTPSLSLYLPTYASLPIWSGLRVSTYCRFEYY